MKKSVSLLFALGLGEVLLLCPKDTVQAAEKGISLCLNTAVPALFPFLFLSRFLLYSGGLEDIRRVLRLNDAVSGCFLLSLISGYPVGAACVRSLYDSGKMGKEEAERSLAFCNNCGPAFLFGAVGTVLQSRKAALIVWGCHIVTALLLAEMFRKRGRSAASFPSDRRLSFAAAFTQSVRDAAQTMGVIGAMVILFQVFLVLPEKLELPKGTQAAVIGLTELTGGVAALQGFSGAISVGAAALMTGWGGLCVHMQTIGILEGSGLNPARYLTGKALHGILSGLLAWGIAAMLLPRDTEAILIVSPAVTMDMSLRHTVIFVLPWAVLLCLTAILCRNGKGDDYKM